MVQVIVHQGNLEQALRALKKKMQRENIYRDMKKTRHEKPSTARVREKRESLRRIKKLMRKKESES